MNERRRRIHWDGRKWGNRLHWQIDAWRLGEDQHGVWVFVPAGTSARRGHEPAVHLPNDAVWLIPEGTWWTVEFTPDGELPVYVNIGMPAIWEGDRVTQVDLDLDVVRTRSGEMQIIDRDEFDDHRVRYAYPPEIVRAAEHAAEGSLGMLRRGEPPFDGCHEGWVAQAR